MGFTQQEVNEFIDSNQETFLHYKKQEAWEEDLNKMLKNLTDFRGEPLSAEEEELFRTAASNVADLENKI